jgi:hypothetical protein
MASSQALDMCWLFGVSFKQASIEMIDHVYLSLYILLIEFIFLACMAS